RVLGAAELVILSRKRIDNDGPKSACQLANFQMTQWVRRFQPRELHKHLLRGSLLDRSTLRREFEQLHRAWALQRSCALRSDDTEGDSAEVTSVDPIAARSLGKGDEM